MLFQELQYAELDSYSDKLPTVLLYIEHFLVNNK